MLLANRGFGKINILITSCTRSLSCGSVYQMENKEKGKGTCLTSLILQSLGVLSNFCWSIICTDIDIVWFADL